MTSPCCERRTETETERERNRELHASACSVFAAHRNALSEHLITAIDAIRALHAHSSSYCATPAFPPCFSVSLVSESHLQAQFEQRIEDLNSAALKWFNETVLVLGESPNVGWRTEFPGDRNTKNPRATDVVEFLDHLFGTYAGIKGEHRILHARAKSIASMFNWRVSTLPVADFKAGTFRIRTNEYFNSPFRDSGYRQEFTWQRQDEIVSGTAALVWLARYREIASLAEDATELGRVLLERRGHVNAGETLAGNYRAMAVRVGAHHLEFKLSPQVAEQLNIFMTEYFFTPSVQVA